MYAKKKEDVLFDLKDDEVIMILNPMKCIQFFPFFAREDNIFRCKSGAPSRRAWHTFS